LELRERIWKGGGGEARLFVYVPGGGRKEGKKIRQTFSRWGVKTVRPAREAKKRRKKREKKIRDVFSETS